MNSIYSLVFVIGLGLIILIFNNKVMADTANLTSLQKYVIFENGTEKPFDNDYWNNKKDGIYVDILDGKPLFSSKDKFDSKTGWPSFSKPINDRLLQKKPDNSYGASRIEARSKQSDIHLGHIFNDGPKDKGGMRYCINSSALKFIAKEDFVKEGYEEYLGLFQDIKEPYQKAILAGGCFWGMEDLFSKIDGVIDVINGYSGGNIENPTYEIVSSDTSKHAESVEVTFDPSVISYDKILRVFFRIHDPTTLNKQGNDIGTRYRSAIFYLNDSQKEIAQILIAKANESGVFGNKIATTLEKFDKFYSAEGYHQDYLAKNPNGYTCHRIRKDWEF
jgi:peptide methionine sulfoxide reductase msrA/msrB